MDIIFINPPLTLKERFGKFAPAGNVMPPLGLCYLAGACRGKGLKTEIIDAPAEGLDVLQVRNRVLSKRPLFVGITATTLSVFNASKVADAIKESNPRIATVIGGPHLSSVPERTLSRFANFDYGVIGEGEETVIELIEAVKKKEDISYVRGLIYRNNGMLGKTDKRDNIAELDDLPMPAWDLLPNYPHPYKPLEVAMSNRLQGSIITSRGCYYDCSYCPKSVFGRGVRAHKISRVMEMIREQYHKYRVRDLEIYDDVLILTRERIKELCHLLIAERLDLVWSCNSTISAVDKDTLKLMKDAGCWKIAFGIESGDQGILKLMNKHLSLDNAKEVLLHSKKAGIVNRGYFIIGFPTETKESIRKTINFAKKASLDMVQFNSFTPLPGAAIYENISQYGEFDDSWDKMNFVNSVFIPNGFDKNTLDKIIQEAYREFYLRPKTFLSFLKRVRNVGTFFGLVKNFFIFLKIVYVKRKSEAKDA